MSSKNLDKAIACLEKEYAAMGAVLKELKALSGKHRLSPEGRETISLAAKKRWREFRARQPEKRKTA